MLAGKLCVEGSRISTGVSQRATAFAAESVARGHVMLPGLSLMANIEIAGNAGILLSRFALRLKNAVTFAAPGTSLMPLDVAASSLGEPFGGRTLLGTNHHSIP
jgi:hypothetical protein